MIHIGLFEGIGGFGIAARWAGWKTYVTCEWMPFPQSVLKHYWPDAYHHGDIKTLTYDTINAELIQRFGPDWRNEPVIITGGFPCQDASIAKQDGKGQQGLQGERTGLFYEFVRLIREFRPRYVVAENVANILQTNGGGDFHQILSELAAMGYDAEWRVCRASEVGAPHHRARLYLVAYPNGLRFEERFSFFTLLPEKASPRTWQFAGTSTQIIRSGAWSVEPPLPCVDDGFSSRVDGRPKITGLGNAVVPIIPFKIFQAINQYETLNKQ